MDFLAVLNKHKKLLGRKGYMETSLDSPDIRGHFFQQVKNAYCDALSAIFVMPEVQEFSVAIAGFFNNRKDIVDFYFHYECHPENRLLLLRSVTARLENIRKEIILRDEAELLDALKTYLLLASERDRVKYLDKN